MLDLRRYVKLVCLVFYFDSIYCDIYQKAESSRNAETVMSQKCTEYMSTITNLKVKNETTENQVRFSCCLPMLKSEIFNLQRALL